MPRAESGSEFGVVLFTFAYLETCRSECLPIPAHLRVLRPGEGSSGGTAVVPPTSTSAATSEAPPVTSTVVSSGVEPTLAELLARASTAPVVSSWTLTASPWVPPTTGFSFMPTPGFAASSSSSPPSLESRLFTFLEDLRATMVAQYTALEKKVDALETKIDGVAAQCSSIVSSLASPPPSPFRPIVTSQAQDDPDYEGEKDDEEDDAERTDSD